MWFIRHDHTFVTVENSEEKIETFLNLVGSNSNAGCLSLGD